MLVLVRISDVANIEELADFYKVLVDNKKLPIEDFVTLSDKAASAVNWVLAQETQLRGKNDDK